MPPDIRIRPARIQEQKALEALQLRAALNNPGDREAMLAHPDAIVLPLEQIAAGQVFVAEHNGAVAGFSAVVPRPDGNSELDGLCVEPAIQRLGIGRALVEHSAQYAREQGSLALHVIGNPHAKAFYIACGFEITGSIKTRFGSGLLMQKSL